MKAISTILLLAGILAGPGYFFYCTSFSGKSLERVTVFSQDVSSFSAGGVTVQSSGANAQWNTPVSFELTPEMNPISVKAVIRYMKPASAMRKRTEYKAELAEGKKTVWARTFSISSKKEKEDDKTIKIGDSMLAKTTIPIKTFSVEKAGPYTLNLQNAGEHGLAVANLDVALRRNVMIPNMVILLSGGMALLLGVAGLVTFGKRRPKNRESE